MKFMNNLISKGCGKLGILIAKRPDYFIIIPVFMSIFLGYCLKDLNYNKDVFHLFTPDGGRAMKDRDHVQNLFKDAPTHDIGRTLDMSILSAGIITCKDGGSVLRKKIHNEVARLNSAILNISITHEDKIYTFYDLCDIDHMTGKCFDGNSYLEVEDVRLDRINEKNISDIIYPLKLDLENLDFETVGFTLGGVTLGPGDTVLSAEAVLVIYFLNITKFDPRGEKWGKEFVKLMQNFDSNYLDITVFTWRSFADGFENTVIIALLYFIGTLIVMVIFAFLTSSSSNGIPWMGILGCISSIMAMISTFGIVSVSNIDLISVAVVVPFLLLGIGMDNTFIIVACWRKTNPSDSVQVRMYETFSHAGSSITLTSLTTLASFVVGIFIIFPGVKIFCIYISIGMAITFVYHLTFFGGWLAVVGKLTNKQKQVGKVASCFCCVSSKHSEQKVDDHPAMRFFRDILGAALINPWGKAVVIILYLGTIASGIYGFTYVTEGIKLQRIVTYDHYLVKFIDNLDKYFRTYPYRIQVVVETEGLDFGDPAVQKRIDNVLDTIESSKYISHNKKHSESWLRMYKFGSESELGKMLDITCEGKHNEEFVACIRNILATIPMIDYFEQDFRFTHNGTSIGATRFVVQAHNVRSTLEDKEMMVDVRRLADSCDLPVTVYNSWFIFFDQFVYIKPAGFQSLIAALIVVIVVSFIFISNPICCVWIGISSVSIFVTVLGYLSYWGVSMDMIGIVGLILCIGFSVDYAFHISYAFVESKEETPDEKLKDALYTVGMPIIQSSVSTIIGVGILAFIPSYCFTAFVKTVFLVISMGTFHGLLCLPVFLSMYENLKYRRGSSSTVSHTVSQEPIIVYSMQNLTEK